ncbi:MAG: hypothetical protein M3R17_00670 [Bacteroidota bacterium]|nr:hypothetical protein [Bacteroidota bacterium]
MNLNRIVLCVFLLCFSVAVKAQVTPVPGNYKDNFLQGNLLMAEKNWPMAVAFFREAYKVDSTNANINYKMGVCYLNTASDKQAALRFLRIASNGISRNYDPYDINGKKAPENTYYYLAQAYHYNYRFDSAIQFFESYKSLLNGRDPETTKEIDMRINWAKNAKEFMASPLPVSISNMGDSINGPLPDYSPVMSVDESIIIFTSRRFGSMGIDGEYYEDILICEKKADGTWTSAHPISPYINTLTNEASISLSTDGNILFIYRDDNGGDIYTSTLQNGEWIYPSAMGGEINTKSWETHACLSADGNTLYFVSDRPGGFGGRDIYRCVRLPTGNWSKALNLGPTINTAADEDAPFIHPDQRTLYFASKGHKSMGGFDIFFTAKNDTGVWAEPINLGYPINTPDDDIFFVTSPDGKRAYFSSVREGGYGDKDVYMANLEQPKSQGLTLLKGRIYNADGSPLTQKIEIIVTNSLDGTLSGNYKPNRNGNFTIILTPGSTYQLSYLVDDKEFSNEIIDVPAGSEFEVIERAIDLRDLVLGKINSDVPKDTVHPLVKTLPGDSIPQTNVRPKNWKAELTSTHNLSFSMFFKYNISEIDLSDPDFKIFIDSVVAHINKNGEISFRITAAASQVPTKKFKDNKDLAADRAEKAKAQIIKALVAKGVDMNKVHWVKVNSYVLGPQYKTDFQKNKAMYEKYQYVKIRGY